MKPTSIATILDELSDGSTIGCFVGTLTKLYEMRTIGAGTEREWTKQNAEMRDAAGKTIPVEFRRQGEEVPPTWKGKILRFESVKGDKGTHGVKILDDTYNGKTTRKLCITGTAEMSFADDTSEAPAPAQAQAPRQQQQPAKPATTTSKAAPSNPLDLRMSILRRATVWNHCYDAAVASALTVAKRHGFAMVPAAVGALASSLYIDTMRHVELATVDVKSVDWSPAKGKTMADLITYLNEQVAATAAARMPAPPNPEKNAMPAADAPLPTDPETPLEEMDEIPF